MHRTAPEYIRSFLKTASVRLSCSSTPKFFSPPIAFSQPPRGAPRAGAGTGAAAGPLGAPGAPGTPGEPGGCAQAAVTPTSTAMRVKPVSRMLSLLLIKGGVPGPATPAVAHL